MKGGFVYFQKVYIWLLTVFARFAQGPIYLATQKSFSRFIKKVVFAASAFNTGYRNDNSR
jgi:hypothetical protein